MYGTAPFSENAESKDFSNPVYGTAPFSENTESKDIYGTSQGEEETAGGQNPIYGLPDRELRVWHNAKDAKEKRIKEVTLHDAPE